MESTKQTLPPNTKLNNDQAASENNWQISLRHDLEQSAFGVPPPEICSQIADKVKQLEFQCDEWCHDFGYKPILDIEVRKLKFHEEEESQARNLGQWRKECQLNSDQTAAKIEETKVSIGSLKGELDELKRRSRLLDEDLLDLISIEREMISVCESESVSIQTVIEKILHRNQDKCQTRDHQI